MQFQRNVWYVVALSDQIGRELRRHVVLNEQILIYRTDGDVVVAIQDRCPHRFAPLSLGTLIGDVVQCKYHGLRFDRIGNCVLNPHSDIIAPHNRIRSYPVQEQHGFVWIWTGDPSLSEKNAVPDLSHMNALGFRTVHSYLAADYRYDILVDNLLDLSHADYLHVGTFAGGSCERSETRVHEKGDDVIVVFNQWNTPAPPGFAHIGERVDQVFQIHWRPGQIICFEASVAPLGGELSKGAKIRFAHIATPQTENTTHYFMSVTRDFDLDNGTLDAQMAARQLAVIDSEDSPMLRSVDAEMGGRDLIEMHPVILPTDKGALQVRRVMKRLIQAEKSDAETTTE